MTAFDLRVNGMTAPLGINEIPVFSYCLSTENEKAEQTAWRILVSSSEERLRMDDGDIWDSLRQEDVRCFDLVYHGKPLCSGQKVYWKVKVWDSCGNESPWSEPAVFEVGLQKQEDWNGYWIGQGEQYEGSQSEAPVFFRTFHVKNPETVVSARAYISGLGLFQASLNEEKLTDTFFEPGESDVTKSIYYVTYDIGDRLKNGENTLSIMLGNGQYTGYTINPVMLLPDGTKAPEGRYQKNDSAYVKQGLCGKKKLIAQVNLTRTDGSVETVCVSDETWRWMKGPITFQNWYGGEDYDACREEICLDIQRGIREGSSRAVRMDAPEGRLISRECPPIRIQESFTAASVRKLGEGHFLVDMGKNGAGFPEIILHGTTETQRGMWIELYPAEMLNEAETAVDQRSCTQSWSAWYDCAIRDSYRIRGTGEERWHSVFCYHGFRYLEVKGFPGDPEPEQFVCHCLYADNDRVGSFACSEETLNKICEITDRSIESNMFWSFTDCPQIEKLGWIETSHLMFRSVAAVFDIRAWMKKIIRDIGDSQLDEVQAAVPGNEAAGFVPGIIPEYYRIGGLYRDPNWNGACVFTPWEYYQYYGETSVLRQAFPVMKRYLDYLDKKAEGNVLENYAQMGEWGEFGEHTPEVLVATCAYYRMLKIAEQTAEILKDPSGSTYRKKAEQVRAAFYSHPDCYHPESRQIGTGSQASWGIALFSGIVDRENEAYAVSELVRVIEKNDWHLTSGEVGLRQVFAALAEHGRSDVVYRMVMNPTAPSYRVFTDRGLTTLPEYWNYEEDWHGMVRSRNHAMMGHVREWLTRYVLGVRPVSAAWETVVIEPSGLEEIRYAGGRVFTPRGTIAVSWEKTEQEIRLQTTIPAGITAEIRVPEQYGENIVRAANGTCEKIFRKEQ